MSTASNREPIGVIGTGYVGLVTAAGFAALGSDVFCVDIDEAKIRGLEDGRVPIWEPGLAELIAEHRERMHFSTDLGPASSTRGCSSWPSARRPPTRATPTSRPSTRWSIRCRPPTGTRW